MTRTRHLRLILGGLYAELLPPVPNRPLRGTGAVAPFVLLVCLPVALGCIFLFGGPFLLEPDSYKYLNDSFAILRAGLLQFSTPSFRSVGYPAFLAGIASVFETHSVFGLKLTQHLLLLLTRLLLFAMALSLTKSKTYAALVVLINCTFLSPLMYANSVMTETVYGFFVTATCLLTVLAVQADRRVLWYFGAILCSVATAWVRPQAKMLCLLVLLCAGAGMLARPLWESGRKRRLLASCGVLLAGLGLAWLLMLPMKTSQPVAFDAAVGEQDQAVRLPSSFNIFIALGLWYRLYSVEGYALEGEGTREFLAGMARHKEKFPHVPEDFWRLNEPAMELLTTQQDMHPVEAIDWMYATTLRAVQADPWRFIKNSLGWLFWNSVTTGGSPPYVHEQAKFASAFPTSREARLLYEDVLLQARQARNGEPAILTHYRFLEERSPEWIAKTYLATYLLLYKYRNAILFLLFLGPGLLLALSGPARIAYLAPLLFYLYHISIWVVWPAFRYYIPVDGMANMFHGVAAILFLDLCRGALWPRIARLWRQDA